MEDRVINEENCFTIIILKMESKTAIITVKIE